MVGDRQELLSSSEVSQEQKVIKLRVSYGGSFHMVRAAKRRCDDLLPRYVCFFGVVLAEAEPVWRGQPKTSRKVPCAVQQDTAGKWGYKNGKSHLESLPVHFKYNDVAFRWTEKVKGDLTGLKYQLPGEELEPDALISVSDDSDLHVSSALVIRSRGSALPRMITCALPCFNSLQLGLPVCWLCCHSGSSTWLYLQLTRFPVSQEMFEEYFRGLNLPGTPAKTFRLRVFLFFDMIQEPLTPAEYEDGCAFFRTARCTCHSCCCTCPSNYVVLRNLLTSMRLHCLGL